MWKKLLIGILLSVAAAVPASASDDPNHKSHGEHDDGVSVDKVWMRLVGPAAKSGAVYGEIENYTDRDIRLISVSTNVARRAELHRTEMSDGVMRMRPVDGGIVIPARGEFYLRPGEHHIMLMGLQGPVAPDAPVQVTFTFDNGVTVNASARLNPEAKHDASDVKSDSRDMSDSDNMLEHDSPEDPMHNGHGHHHGEHMDMRH